MGYAYLTAVHRGTGASERRVDYIYDARGYMSGLSTRMDPTRTVSVVYGDIDGRGQPRETTVPGIGATMSMEPDVAGAPISVSPPGQPAHGFEYSIIGQATEYRPPGVSEVPNPAVGIPTFRTPRARTGGSPGLANWTSRSCGEGRFRGIW